MNNAELRARITTCWGSTPDAEAVEAVIAKLDCGLVGAPCLLIERPDQGLQN